ncbi:MAG: Fic family protein [Gammaproteobacteria bacterium]|nr:Fic family protein [Gammaproteobacteria bacterium]
MSPAVIPIIAEDTFLEDPIKTAALAFNADEISNQAWKDFNLSKFLSRYLAGDESLKSARHVTRKRLSLAEFFHSLDIPVIDESGSILQQQVHAYQEAKAILSRDEKLTEQAICAAHQIIAPTAKRVGEYRQTQNFIGKSLKQAKFVPPKPEFVACLMSNLVDFYNHSKLPPLHRALIFHLKFLAIHPFLDGNGRLARLLFEVMLERTAGGQIVHPWLYRLHCHDFRFQTSTQTMGQYHLFCNDALGFWPEAFTHSAQLMQKLLASYELFFHQFTGRLSLLSFADDEYSVALEMINEPLVNGAKLAKQYDWDKAKADRFLLKLQSIGLIDISVTRYPENYRFFYCTPVFQLWSQLDEIICSMTGRH